MSKTLFAVSERWVCLGVDEDIDSCDCCGRTGLKRTIIMGIRNLESNEVERVGNFGCVCAARHSGLPAARVRVDARKAQDERELQSAKAEGARVNAILRTMTAPEPERNQHEKYPQTTVLTGGGVTVWCHGEVTPERLSCFRSSWFSEQARGLIGKAPAFVVDMPPSSWHYEAFRAAMQGVGR